MPQFQHIREICARVVLAGNEDQFQATVNELKIAIGDRSVDEMLIQEAGEQHAAEKKGSGG